MRSRRSNDIFLDGMFFIEHYMKKFICFLLCVPMLLVASLSPGELSLISVEEKSNPLEGDEVACLERLIEINESRLAMQKEIRDRMKLFKEQKNAFILGNQTQKHSFSMVSNARNILGNLKQEHLVYLFSQDYLEELMFFSSIAGKSTPVRP